MASSSSKNYQKLNSTAASTAIYDPENEKISFSSFEMSQFTPTSTGSSEFSSAYISPEVSDHKSPSWLMAFEKLSLKHHVSEFDSLDLSNIRVTMPPSDPWDDITSDAKIDDSLKTHNSNSANFDVFRLPLSNCTNTSTYSTTISDFTYSILSNTIDERPVWEDYGFKIHPKQTQEEQIALDFEMNGKTTDVTSFEPRISSTPYTSRKYDYQEYFACQHENVFEPSYEAQECFKVDQNFTQNGFESYFEPMDISVAKNNIPLQNNFNAMLKKRKTSKVKPVKKSLSDHCVFCKNNGAEPSVYNTHKVMDAKGRCSCPMLRQYKCPICNAYGDRAHTTKYCPKKKIFTESDMKKATKGRSKSKALKF